MNERLTEIFARKLLPPPRGQTIAWDSEVKGFGLRVTAGGARSFLLDYRIDGRQRRITVGAFPDWSVAAARNAAKKLKQEVDTGHDPMGARRAKRVAPTVEDLWERYQEEVLPNKSSRSQADERSMWLKIILPQLGKEAREPPIVRYRQTAPRYHDHPRYTGESQSRDRGRAARVQSGQALEMDG